MMIFFLLIYTLRVTYILYSKDGGGGGADIDVTPPSPSKEEGNHSERSVAQLISIPRFKASYLFAKFCMISKACLYHQWLNVRERR